MNERLNKLIARAGIASRRAADRLIEAGRVTVNGEVIRELGTRVDVEADAVKVDGQRVVEPGQPHLYVALNKPRGVVTTFSDPEGRRTVKDLLGGLRGRIVTVGRLDYNSEGLLLLTDDGDLARDLMHPRSDVARTYVVKVSGRPGREQIECLRSGTLRVAGRRARPAECRVVRPGANSWVEVTVHEGRKHHIRVLMEAVGHPVQRLRRIRYGGVELGDLAPGRWRILEQAEVERLRDSIRSGKSPDTTGESRRRDRR